VKCPVENLIIKDAFLNNFEENAFINVFEKGEVGHLSLDGVLIDNKDRLIDDASGNIKTLHTRFI